MSRAHPDGHDARVPDRHGAFQLAEVAVPRALLAEILRRIGRPRGSPVPTA